jgi:hypothetical protein
MPDASAKAPDAASPDTPDLQHRSSLQSPHQAQQYHRRRDSPLEQSEALPDASGI